MTDGRLARALDAIDAYNRRDPNTETVDGAARPREAVYAERLTAWVLKLRPDAPETLRIAARGQHVGRWTIPRESYPMDRGGYLRWREALKQFHARTVAEIMAQAGYTEAEMESVRAIILKKAISSNPDAQTVEDALCLIFLETQFAQLRAKTPDDKMIDILRKTWRKMSPAGKAAALSLPLAPGEKALIERAIR